MGGTKAGVWKGKRVAVVGASAGIGMRVAQRAVESGAEVVFAARREDALAKAIDEAGGGHAVAVDVRDDASCAALRVACEEAVGRLDAIVYAAGMSHMRWLSEMDEAALRDVFETNTIGASLATRHLLPLLVEDGVASYLSSISAARPRPGLVAYGSSKAALDEMVRGWQAEHRTHRFTSISIGDTLGTEFGLAFAPQAMGEFIPRWMAEAHLYARQMTASELAGMIVDLLALQLSTPGVHMPHVTLEPPGGPATLEPDKDRAMAMIPEDYSEE